MPNDRYKEKYKEVRMQIDMIREKSLGVTIDALSETPRPMFIPRSVISYDSNRALSSIMTMPVTQRVQVADWFCRKESL